MNRILSLLSLAPVLRGFVAIAVSGASFPLCGVMVLRLDLVPLRYMLMHGVILGGAVALASNLPLVPVIAVTNVALVAMLLFLNKGGASLGGESAAVMVLSMAAASLITHIRGVPAKDTLSLLWGSPFALSRPGLVLLIMLSLALVLYVLLFFRTILPLFFDRSIAAAQGIRVRLHHTIMVMLIALVVAVAMQLLGAFLIDALLILPVLCASSLQKLAGRHGIRRLFLLSSAVGFMGATAGYAASLAADLPPGAVISVIIGAAYAVLTAIHKSRRHQT